MSNPDPYRQNPPPGGYPQQPPYPPQPIPLPPQFPGAPQYPQQYGYPQQQPAYYPQQPQPVAYQPQPIPVQPVPLSPVAAPVQAEPIPLSAWQTPQPARPVAPVPVPAAPQPAAAPVRHAGPRPVLATPQNKAAAAVAAAPRPIPANRPVIAPVKSGADGKVTVQPQRPEDQPPPDDTAKIVKGAPPWMVSMIVHAVILLIMGLIIVVKPPKEIIELISPPDIFAEKLGEQVLDDELQSPDSMDLEVVDPALSLSEKPPVDDPFAAPPIVDVNIPDANSATSDVQAPAIGLALTGRQEGSKKSLLAAYGGTATTEASVRDGLLWLKKQQKEDGTWSLMGPYSNGGYAENRVAATAMALLAFQGAGHTHQGKGEFQPVVAKAWKALLAMQNADGEFQGEAAYNQKTYGQAQASIAVCEAYGMTKDKSFQGPAQKAVNYALFSQSPQGGWRYSPKEDADTSVTGWYVMALQSAMMAGLDVPSPTFDKINGFLDSVGSENQSKYAYMPGQDYRLSMTAEGLLCREYLGWKHNDERLRSGVNYLLANPIDYNSSESHQNVYYWYYATQTLHHMDGDDWDKWNKVMRQAVPTHQIKSGAEKGSWAPSSGDSHGAGAGGRLYTTCLSIYMLEVYYRHLPIYKYRLK
jgi:hypothetical protein